MTLPHIGPTRLPNMRLFELAHKQCEGTITPAERREVEIMDRTDAICRTTGQDNWETYDVE